jgi:hypothetical protein
VEWKICRKKGRREEGIRIIDIEDTFDIILIFQYSNILPGSTVLPVVVFKTKSSAVVFLNKFLGSNNKFLVQSPQLSGMISIIY